MYYINIDYLSIKNSLICYFRKDTVTNDFHQNYIADDYFKLFDVQRI